MPNILGGDQYDPDYAPHLYKDGKFVGVQEKRMSENMILRTVLVSPKTAMELRSLSLKTLRSESDIIREFIEISLEKEMCDENVQTANEGSIS